MLVDVFSKGITGKAAEAALGKAAITVNKNAIPFDQNPPMVASGIRVGTPAVTTRGMREPEMAEIAELIVAGIEAREDEGRQAQIRERVAAIADRFPVPGLEHAPARAMAEART
jgi:glycine hydroxymethyltransferase